MSDILKKGTRLDPTWKPSTRLMEWTRKIRKDFNREIFTECVESFVDYWVSLPGKGATKLDWDRTFQNYVRQYRIPAYHAQRYRHQQLRYNQQNADDAVL